VPLQSCAVQANALLCCLGMRCHHARTVQVTALLCCVPPVLCTRDQAVRQRVPRGSLLGHAGGPEARVPHAQGSGSAQVRADSNVASSPLVLNLVAAPAQEAKEGPCARPLGHPPGSWSRRLTWSEHTCPSRGIQASHGTCPGGQGPCTRPRLRRFLESVNRYYSDFSGRKLAEAASHVNEMLYKANMSMNKAVRQGSSLASMQVGRGARARVLVCSIHVTPGVRMEVSRHACVAPPSQQRRAASLSPPARTRMSRKAAPGAGPLPVMQASTDIGVAQEQPAPLPSLPPHA